MKLGNWIAALGCIGLGVGVVVAAQGCTVTVSSAPCDGGCGSFPGEDSAVPVDTGVVNQLDSSLIDTGSTAPDPCNTCLYGQCVGPYANCVGNSSCLDIYQCATSPACAADGGKCIQDCYSAGTALGKSLYLTLGYCDQAAECTNITPSAACATICNPAPATCVVPDAGPGADSAPPEDAAGADAASLSCADCTQAYCGSQLAACAAGTDCAQYNQCLAGCASLTCDQACATVNPKGAAAATALGSCEGSSCPQCFNN